MVVLVLILFGTIEFRHHLRFSHFVGLGLHADYTVSHVDLSIPGISKVYNATLTNFGPFPRKVSACEFLTDAMAHGTALAFAIQRWDKTASAWNTALQPSTESFCKPYPLGIVQGQLVEKWLWPGQNLSIGSEATGARFRKGEVVRFVLFAANRWAATTGYPTAAFEIDEQIDTAVPLRVRHLSPPASSPMSPPAPPATPASLPPPT